MAERIERKEFVRRLAERMQADEATASAWLDGVVEEMYQTFRSGAGLTLPRLVDGTRGMPGRPASRVVSVGSRRAFA